MSDYTRGVLTVPAVILGIALTIVLIVGAMRLISKVWPAHWAISGPGRKSADVHRVFRNINAAGRHVGSFRKLVSVGPWTLHLTRYRPGNVEDEG
jgi:hypothetical protein